MAPLPWKGENERKQFNCMLGLFQVTGNQDSLWRFSAAESAAPFDPALTVALHPSKIH